MADSTLEALTALSLPVQSTDLFYVVRAGADHKVEASEVVGATSIIEPVVVAATETADGSTLTFNHTVPSGVVAANVFLYADGTLVTDAAMVTVTLQSATNIRAVFDASYPPQSEVKIVYFYGGARGETGATGAAGAAGANGADGADGADGAGVSTWVNFDGTGTPAIRASLNVSSITDNGAGDWTINFTSSLASTNYATVVTGKADVGGDGCITGVLTRATGSVRVNSLQINTSSAALDNAEMSVAIFI